MKRVFARTGIIAVAMAVTAVLSGSLPANAFVHGTEVVTTYYSNAQHNDVVGVSYLGPCPSPSDWGSRTAYYSLSYYVCAIQ